MHVLVCSEFVDELPELDEIYVTNPEPQVSLNSETATPHIPPQARPTSSPAGPVAVESAVPDDTTFDTSWTPQSFQSPTQVTSPFKRRRTNDTDITSFASVGQTSPSRGHYSIGPTCESSTRVRGEDAIDSLLRAADLSEQRQARSNLLDSSSNVRISPFASSPVDPGGVWPHTNIQEACLMRYFIDELACWVIQASSTYGCTY